MEVIIRPANASDIDRVIEIVNLVVPIMHSVGNHQWDDKYPQRQNFGIDLSNGDLWVADDDGIVAGVAALTKDQSPEYADCGWDLSEGAIVPHRLAVHPHHQGKGIARLFLQKAEELAKNAGFQYVRIDTNKLNTNMQRLLSKEQFVFSGEIALLTKPPDMRFLCYQKVVN